MKPPLLLLLALALSSSAIADEFDTLKKQMAEFRASITTASPTDLLRLHREIFPNDKDLTAIYGENDRYAIAIRDRHLGELDKNIVAELERLRREPALRPEQISVSLKDGEGDLSVMMARRHGLLKGEFLTRKISMHLPESIEGYGAMIYVNGRWVVFIGLDRFIIEKQKSQAMDAN